MLKFQYGGLAGLLSGCRLAGWLSAAAGWLAEGSSCWQQLQPASKAPILLHIEKHIDVQDTAMHFEEHKKKE